MTFPCFKCNGSGQTSFTHIAEGVCFTCKGTGKLAYRKRAQAEVVEAHPELVVPAAERATNRQWDYLMAVAGDNTDNFIRALKMAGCENAEQRYVSRKVISRAIEWAKSDEKCGVYRRANRSMEAWEATA